MMTHHDASQKILKLYIDNPKIICYTITEEHYSMDVGMYGGKI